MYKRTEQAIRKNPPPAHTCMCKAQFGYATYSDIAFCIPSRIDACGAFMVIEYENKNMTQTQQHTGSPLRIPQATSKGYIEVCEGGIFDGTYPNSKTRRGRVQGGGNISPTITSQGEPLNLYEGKEESSYRIRKLTPRECFRLMGVSDQNITKIEKAGISRSQQYKMCGNSIVVDCLAEIMRTLLVDKNQSCEGKQLSLF